MLVSRPIGRCVRIPSKKMVRADFNGLVGNFARKPHIFDDFDAQIYGFAAGFPWKTNPLNIEL